MVVTMGMPSIFYRLWFLSHGIAGMRRSILRFAGISPVRETLFGMVAGAGDATRAKGLGQIRKLGERAR
ncbi:MAG: flavodoxin family protein, partial [Mesorhizobium sp.]